MHTKKIMIGSPEHLLSSASYLMLNLPTTCSYRCRKCAIHALMSRYKSALTDAERRTLITTARQARIAALVVIGMGEPTENFTIMRQVIGAAHDSGMITIMFATLNGLDRDQAGFYATHGVSIFVSLDSLQPDAYRWLTGTGDLPHILRQVELLRSTYRRFDPPRPRKDGSLLVRLGVNTTVSAQNVNELLAIRQFADDKDMQFIANPPMQRGRLKKKQQWAHMVSPVSSREAPDDDQCARLRAEAERHSDTGGHSSLAGGVCNYFHSGVSVDVDGEFLTCGYAGETRHRLGNARGATPVDLLLVNMRVRDAYRCFCQEACRKPPCPLRDPDFAKLVKLL